TTARQVMPFLVLVLLHRAGANVPGSGAGRDATLRLCGISFLGSLLTLGISPEMGVVQVLGLSVYCVHRVFFRGRSWIWPLVGAVSSLPLWLLVFPGSLWMTSSISQGADCFPVVPAPHVLIYLAILCWVVPVVLQSAVTWRPSDESPLLLGWVLVVIAMMPA